MENIYWILIFIFIAIIAVCAYKYFGHAGGMDSFFGGVEDFFGGAKNDDKTRGDDKQNGFFYAKGEDLQNVTINGSGLIKDCKIKGDLDVTGHLEIKNTTVEGKTKVNGNITSVMATFKDMDIDGTGELYRSEANKVAICGKLRVKQGAVKEIKYKEKCDTGIMSAPFIKLKGVPDGDKVKIDIPSNLNREQVVSIEA